MKPQETTTIQIPAVIHRKLKRGASKENSKLMPFAASVITAGLDAKKSAESRKEKN